MTHDELVEKVTRAICEIPEGIGGWEALAFEAEAAIAVVLEEAAKVADEKYNNYQDEFCSDWNVACRKIAAAIRALVKERDARDMVVELAIAGEEKQRARAEAAEAENAKLREALEDCIDALKYGSNYPEANWVIKNAREALGKE